MQRYLIPSHGPNETTAMDAFKVAVQLCAKHGVNELTLVLLKKDSFSGTALENVLGKSVCKQLAAGKVVTIPEVQLRLRFESIAALQKRPDPQIALAFYVDNYLNVVDTLRLTKALVYVPWHEDSGTEWQRTWNALVPGQQVKEIPLSLSPEVVKSLTRLTNSINLSSGLGHQLDLRDAKEMFAKLHAQGLNFVPLEIGIWARRNGWQPKHADDLAKLAESYRG